MAEMLDTEGVIRYSDIRKQAEGKGNQEIAVKGKVVKSRGYSMPDDEALRLAQKWRETGVFQSPYKEGTRTHHLRALAQLGLNQAWTLTEIKRALIPLMGSRWDRFKTNLRGKKPKEVELRILDNFRGMQRLCNGKKGGVSAYGFRLSQIGCAIEIFTQREEIVVKKDSGKNVTHEIVTKYIRLNTHTSEPNTGRGRACYHLKFVKNRESIPPVDFSAPTMGPLSK